MNENAHGTEFGQIRKALEDGEITLEDVATRFVDFKAPLGGRFDSALHPVEAVLDYRCSDAQWDCDGSAFWKVGDEYCYCTTSAGPEAVMRLYEKLFGYQVEEIGHRGGFLQFRLYPPYQERTDDYDSDASRAAGFVSGDVMNSFWTTYREIINRKTGRHYTSRDESDILELLEHGRLNLAAPEKTLETILSLDDSAEKLTALWGKIAEQVRIFAYLTHTLGNMIPCQKGFNRGRYSITMDYWDITLMYVKDWYLNRQGRPSAGDVPNNVFNASILDRCHPWLNHFGFGVEGWNAFVEDNYLLPYIEKEGDTYAKDENGAYEVRRFFSGHDFWHLLPETEEQFLACLLSMNAAIIARGNLMGEALGDDPAAGLFFKSI